MTALGTPWWSLLLAAWLLAAAGMAILFASHRVIGKAGIVDVGWSFGVGIVGAGFALAAPGYVPRRVLVALLILVWCVRLGSTLLGRVLRLPEDGRYVRLLEAWGQGALPKLFWFFQFQAVWVVMFATPCLVAAWPGHAPLSWQDYFGALWACASIAGEGLADRQLARFRENPAHRGKVCRDGLWSWSRHPNYFFEWLFWWSFVIIGIGGPWGWVTLAGPAVMFLFLYRVTGIPHTEAQAIASRGEAYRDYQRTTSAFFPWPPRRSS